MSGDTIFPPPPKGEYSSAREKHLEALREKSPALQAIHQREQDTAEATREMTKDQVAETLGTTIVEDKTSKTVTFYGTTLNYTEEEQQNFSSNAPSSTGKSYVTGETLEYFPQEDILSKGYTSPTAFFHENSKLCTSDGVELPNRNQYVDEHLKEWEEQNPLPPKGEGREKWKADHKAEIRRLKGEWDAIDKYYIVDLEQKILYFRDQPHDKLLQNLRPVLSHDAKIIECNITDKSKEGGNRTKKVLLIGYPTVHFNSVRFSLDEQERTRLWLTSPEITQDKLRKSLKQQSRALANRTAYKNTLNQNRDRELLKLRVRLIKESTVRNIILRPEDADTIYQMFIKNHPTLTPRHQRDFPRIVSMIKAHALFNQWTREHTEDGTAIYANERDIQEGYELCRELIKSNELGLPPHVHRFYEEALRPALEAALDGLYRQEVSRLYYTFYHTRIGEKQLGNMVSLLLETGLVVEETDPNDRRRKKIYSPNYGGEKDGCEKKSEQERGGPLDRYTLNQDLDRVYRYLAEQSVDPVAEEVAVDLDIESDRVTKLLSLLEKDGRAFQPCPGYWRFSNG